MPEPEMGEEPTPSLLEGAYNQTYVIRAAPPETDPNDGRRRVLFKCGNWCYSGSVEFTDPVESLASIPYLIPDLQRQQGKLGFFCSAHLMPEDSEYFEPLEFVKSAAAFIAEELASDKIGAELTKWSEVFPWMDDDKGKAYFELAVEAPQCMADIGAVASKTYARGLVLVMIYHDGTFYAVMEDGEGDQPLLDIRFPDVSQHGQGLHLSSYGDQSLPWRKLTLWQSVAKDPAASPLKGPASREKVVADLSSRSYMQAYVVLKSDSGSPSKPGNDRRLCADDPFREVMFRFGSWCYAGKVNLAPSIALVDIPHVIPILRMQQNQLEFVCDVTAMPRRSPFTPPMDRIMKLAPLMEREIMESEALLANLIKRLSMMGLGESISEWLDGDSNQSFFEFQESTVPGAGEDPSSDPYAKVDVLACKSYNSSGVVIIVIYFRGSYYVTMADGQTEQPLLDSRFPDVSEKGRGYQLRAYAQGIEGWPQLRKVSVWQTGKALRSQVEKAQTKLEEIRSAKGDDAMEAAATEQRRIEQLTNEALRSSPSTEAEDKAVSPMGGRGRGAAKGTPSSLSAGEAAASSPVAGSKPGPGPVVGTPDRVKNDGSKPLQATGVLGEQMDSDDKNVVIKKAQGFQAAKSLTGTKVALPHHLAPMQGDGMLKDRLKQLQSEIGSGDVSAPWDARGRPLGPIGGLGAKK